MEDNKNTSIINLEKRIKVLESELKERDTRISDLEGQNHAKDEDLLKVKENSLKQSKDLKATISNLRKSLKRKTDDNDYLYKTLDGVYEKLFKRKVGQHPESETKDENSTFTSTKKKVKCTFI